MSQPVVIEFVETVCKQETSHTALTEKLCSPQENTEEIYSSVSEHNLFKLRFTTQAAVLIISYVHCT